MMATWQAVLSQRDGDSMPFWHPEVYQHPHPTLDSANITNIVPWKARIISSTLEQRDSSPKQDESLENPSKSCPEP